MTAADHNTQFEEVMAWLDGELSAEAAARVEAHVAECADCRRLEADMRSVSGQMAEWRVPTAPATLTLKPARAVAWRRWMPIAAMLAIGVGGAVFWAGSQGRMELTPDRAAAVNESADLSYDKRLQSGVPDAAPLAAPVEAVAVAGPLIVRTAHLTLVLRDLDAGRVYMERIVREVGGFPGSITVSGAGSDPRALSATLRIPTAKLDDTLAALKKLGQVTSEGMNGEDVTQQSVDLDARLANARASEKRLVDILANRTGKLSDVLNVEREISRVRGEIEQMEAERKSLDRRITYAVLALEMVQERKAAMNLGPLPVSTQLQNALVDGWTRALTNALETITFIIRTVPVLLLWTLVLAPPIWLVKRRLALHGAGS
jgi:hypothetical protein